MARNSFQLTHQLEAGTIDDTLHAWFEQQGYPKGKLGVLMKGVCDAKAECGNRVFDPLRKTTREPGAPRPKKTDWNFDPIDRERLF